jgi:hypothetical protein
VIDEVVKGGNNMKYNSSVTFLYYKDFSYGIDFMESILNLELVMNQDFARVYKVNEKAFIGIVKQKESSVPGSTLFSLTTSNVELEYNRFRTLEVYMLTELKDFPTIPLKSFFFEDLEGHRFEIQQFLTKEDEERF